MWTIEKQQAITAPAAPMHLKFRIILSFVAKVAVNLSSQSGPRNNKEMLL